MTKQADTFDSSGSIYVCYYLTPFSSCPVENEYNLSSSHPISQTSHSSQKPWSSEHSQLSKPDWQLEDNFKLNLVET